MIILSIYDSDFMSTFFQISIMLFVGVYLLYTSLSQKSEMGTDTYLRGLLGGFFGIIMAIIFTILELSK